MQRTSRLGVIGFALLALVTTATLAQAQDITYNALPGADFTKFKTYKWVTIEGAQKPDQIMDQMIRTSIEAELAKKGLTKTDSDNADLYIGYQGAVTEERQWNTFSSGGVGWGYGGVGPYGYGGGGMSTTTTTQSTIKVGMLELDMYDRAAKQLVWKGGASKTLDAKASPEKRQKNINKAMEKLFKKFPPPVKK